MNSTSVHAELYPLTFRREPTDPKWRHINRNTRKGRAGVGNRSSGATKRFISTFHLSLLSKKKSDDSPNST